MLRIRPASAHAPGASGEISSAYGGRSGVAAPELIVVQTACLGGGVSGLACSAIARDDPAKQAFLLSGDGRPTTDAGSTADEHDGQRSQTETAEASVVSSTEGVLNTTDAATSVGWRQAT
ncbi:hypothetical protein D4Q71_24550 [Rhodopseudomonas palustris]|nr:hypothetical protein B1S06_16850 [Rhodopseudomonas palustris]RJF60663.1 hypothetical protein D4Q71_24550 [Rhodopseudomonas palustris]